MIFNDKKHETLYSELCSRMKYLDCYHRSVAYLLALDNVVREHISDVFDFQEDIIIRSAFRHGWQTGTSRCTVSLMFNLWNGYTGESPEDANGFTVDSIFSGSYSYAPFYWQAIKLRYELPE